MTEKSPQRDDKHNGWIQRFLRRRPAHGDTIAAQVEENVENVAVGKNIIQIIGNTLNVPPVLVTAIVIGLVILMVAGLATVYYNLQSALSSGKIISALNATPTPIPTPTPTSLPFAPATAGETLIVITRFYSTAATDSEPHQKIKRKIAEELDKLEDSTVTVAVDPNTILAAEQRTEAEELGKRYNASMTIWGEDTGVEVVVNFLNLRRPASKAADVRINETMRTQLADPKAYAQFITRDLPGRLAFLALFAVGQSYYLDAEHNQAIEVIEVAVSLDRQSGEFLAGLADAYYLLGWLYQQQPNMDRAIVNYNYVIELAPDYTDAYNNRGVAHFFEGNLDAAMSDFHQTITFDPGYASAYNNLGRVFYRRGEYAQSLAEHMRAVELALDNPVFHFNLGLAQERIGDLPASVDAYRRAIALEPGYIEAFNNLGFTYLLMAEYEQAMAAFQQGLTLDPGMPNLHKNLGRVLLEQGKVAEAAAELQRAIDLFPEGVYAEAFYFLAHAYQQQGKLTDACAALEEYGAVALDDSADRAAAAQALAAELECD